jgi:hypothetical protein
MTQTKEYIKEMGQTGAGIHHADEVITSIDSAVTNCWSMSLYADESDPKTDICASSNPG